MALSDLIFNVNSFDGQGKCTVIFFDFKGTIDKIIEARRENQKH